MKMTQKCRRCKRTIEEGSHCPECKQIIIQEKIEKQKNRRISKTLDTIEYGKGEVKKYAEGKFWCSTHVGCFRGGKSESEEHLDTKYERWKYHTRRGRTVYTELILKPGLGRPDLVIVDKGHIFCEEIVKTEKEASLIAKENKYPWPVSVIKVGKN